MADLRLAFDTSTPVGSVAVGRGGQLLAHAELTADARHAETLLPALDALLTRAGIQPRALQGVVLGGGPGSFTGVRIAAATARGMVRALGIPLHVHSSLLALAAAPGPALPAGSVCALLDARRGQVYAGCWRFARDRLPEVVLAPCVAPVAEVLGRLEVVLGRLAAGGVSWVGQGATRYAEELRAAGARPGPERHPDARALLALTALDPAASRVADPAAWEPEYLRPSGAERGVRG
ncbi:MAG: tRNA (adenosine(37)-N6)-threonylcarbamoyltransferase complex dimerization subunit type 1 TsaB [Gemmatimonadota bacterium]